MKKSPDHADDEGTVLPPVTKARAYGAAAALDLLCQLDHEPTWEMTREMLEERQITATVKAKLFPAARRVK